MNAKRFLTCGAVRFYMPFWGLGYCIARPSQGRDFYHRRGGSFVNANVYEFKEDVVSERWSTA
jgi:hypothetical protein